MKVHVAARSREYAERFQQLNPQLEDVDIHQGVQSLFVLLQSIIDGEDDYALFLHDDVVLPSGFADNVQGLIGRLSREWPNWGLCGNAGIVTPTLAEGKRICRFLYDPHGGPSLGGFTLPAETIDGNCMLLNCRALRAAAVKMPALSGYQLYDISLSIEALGAGLAVVLAPELALYHDSMGDMAEFYRAAGDTAVLDYLSGRLANRYISTLNGRLKIPFTGRKSGQFDLCERAIASAAKHRSKAKIAIIIRSKSQGTDLLQRSIISALAFAAATDSDAIRIYLMADPSEIAKLGTLSDQVALLSVDFCTSPQAQAAMLLAAVNSLQEDHVLVLDEGNWLFPNDAQSLCQLLACLPSWASLIVDSQNFFEEFTVPGETDWRNSTLRLQKRFNSVDWVSNFSRADHIPNCGAFYSRSVLAEQLPIVFEKMKGCENAALFLIAALHPRSVIFSVPKLVSGISVRPCDKDREGKTHVGERLIAQRNEAELAQYLSANRNNNVSLSLGRALSAQMNDHIADNQTGPLSKVDRIALTGSRIVHGALVFATTPRNYKANSKLYIKSLRQRGLRGLVRSIADTRMRKQGGF